MIPLDPVLIVYGQTTTIETPTRAVGSVYLDNRTQYYLKAKFDGTPISDWIPPDSARFFDLSNVTGFNSNIFLTPQIIGQTSTTINPATQQAVCTLYQPGEAVPPLVPLYPGVAALTVANQIINDGNVLGSSLVESTPSGNVQSFVVIKNDGTVQIWCISNGVVTEMLNIVPGGPSVPATVHFPNGIIVDAGAANITGNSQVTGQLQVSNGLGVTGGGFQATGNSQITGQFIVTDVSNFQKLLTASLGVAFTTGQITRVSHFSGTGPVTGAAHGLGTTPDVVIVQPNSSAVQSWAVNSGNASTINVVIGAGIAWAAVAIKF